MIGEGSRPELPRASWSCEEELHFLAAFVLLISSEMGPCVVGEEGGREGGRRGALS